MTFLLHEVQVQEEGYSQYATKMLKTANVSMQEFSNFFGSELELANFWGDALRSSLQAQQISA